MKLFKYVTVIPARGGSKRFPGKNIFPFAGKPLIAHSIDFSRKSPLIGATYVTTDAKEIKEIALKYGADIIIRPNELGGDFVTSAEVMKDAAQQLISQGLDFDYVVLLQPTNPLRPSGLLERAVEHIKVNGCKSLFTVSRSNKKLGKIKDNSFVPWNYHFGQRSQDMEPLFYENGLLYITHRELVLDGIIMDEKSFPMEVNHIFGEVDIDTKEDLAYGEYVFAHYKN